METSKSELNEIILKLEFMVRTGEGSLPKRDLHAIIDLLRGRTEVTARGLKTRKAA